VVVAGEIEKSMEFGVLHFMPKLTEGQRDDLIDCATSIYNNA